MDERDSHHWRFEEGAFLALVLLVTLAFAWLIAPFFGAILWGVVAAILFTPVNHRLVTALKGHRNLAAALTLLLILALVILPAFMLGISLVQEAGTLYSQIESGEIDFAGTYETIRGMLPAWASAALGASGLGELATAKKMPDSVIASGLQSIASRALLFGQGALRFIAALGVMLYLTFFLLRDGESIGEKLRLAVPLRPDLRDALISHFVIVVRATIKGTVVVAIIQGTVGGLIFWMLGIEGALLWGLLMGFFSLVPAVGTGIVWVPVALYLLFTGSIWQGAVLIGCGFFVIGLIDNLLRPILVGRDTRMPDFVVLISTLAGLQLLGLNGFIVGPMNAALFIAVWKIVTEMRENSHA